MTDLIEPAVLADASASIRDRILIAASWRARAGSFLKMANPWLVGLVTRGMNPRATPPRALPELLRAHLIPTRPG